MIPPDIEHNLLLQGSLPLDMYRDMRLQEKWEQQMQATITAMKALVRSHPALSVAEQHALLWQLCFVQTHLENQTHDMETNLKAGCN